jgi:hypothetical protein
LRLSVHQEVRTIPTAVAGGGEGQLGELQDSIVRRRGSAVGGETRHGGIEQTAGNELAQVPGQLAHVLPALRFEEGSCQDRLPRLGEQRVETFLCTHFAYLRTRFAYLSIGWIGGANGRSLIFGGETRPPAIAAPDRPGGWSSNRR